MRRRTAAGKTIPNRAITDDFSESDHVRPDPDESTYA